MLYGRTNGAIGSRFLKELPEDGIVRTASTEPRRPSYADSSWNHYSYQRPARSELSARPATPAANVPSFQKGDMVQHTAFGQGMVLSVLSMGGDALLEIAFDKIGTKKLMAKSASAHMKKL